jgi:LysM repeat protein
MRFLIYLISFFCGSCFVLAETIHIVRKNETLSAIAQKYGVSSNAIQSFNGISNPNLLFVGKKLKIPSGSSPEIPYMVKKGDSLGSIASRFGVSLSALSSRNGITSPNLIRIGQKIVIPIKGSSHSPSNLLPSSLLKTLSSIRPKSGKWKKIIIHHSATPVDDAMNMHRVHKARGMKNGLAYHFVISNGSRKASDGEVFIGGRWKSQLDGGHVKKLSWNQTCIGICLIGNFELKPPSSRQLKALEGLCEYLMKRCSISKSHVTTHKILHKGHTACPGKYLSLPSFIRRLNP